MVLLEIKALWFIYYVNQVTIRSAMSNILSENLHVKWLGDPTYPIGRCLHSYGSYYQMAVQYKASK